MTGNAITLGDVVQLLGELSFERLTVQTRGTAFRHPPTGTIIMLADRKPERPARGAELAALRKQLAENNILQGREFDRRLGAGE